MRARCAAIFPLTDTSARTRKNAPAEGFGSDYGEDKAAEVINEFLSRLEKEERIVFVRRYWFSDTVKDIAERMGFSESKVKSLLFRLRKKLKEKLVKEGIGV